MKTESLTGRVLQAALKVHAELGCGLLKTAYESCLAWELRSGGLSVEQQHEMPVVYRGHRVSGACRVDMVVARSVLVNLLTAEEILPLHRAQMRNSLRLFGGGVGILVNFWAENLARGIVQESLSPLSDPRLGFRLRPRWPLVSPFRLAEVR